MNTSRQAQLAPPRLIDTLTLGFNLALNAVAAIVLATALDLFYWLGPAVTIGQVWRDAAARFRALGVGAEAANMADQVATRAAELNTLQVLSGAISSGANWPPAVPSLLASAPDVPTLGRIVELSNAGAALLLLLGLLVVGWLLGSVYLTLVAASVRGEPVSAAALAQWAGATWLRVMALNLLVFALMIGASIPLSVAVFIAGLIHPMAVGFVVFMALATAVWVWVHGLFTIPALVMDRVNPLRAYWRSVRLMRRHFWPALGLLALMFVLSTGLGELWQMLAQSPLGAPIGMIGNAFVGTAVAAALLLFYRDRPAGKDQPRPATGGPR